MTRAHAVILAAASAACFALAAVTYFGYTGGPSTAVQACKANRAYLPSMMRQCLADYAAMRKGNR